MLIISLVESMSTLFKNIFLYVERLSLLVYNVDPRRTA